MLHRIEGHPLRLNAQAQIRSFGFERAELTLLDVLRARPQTLESLNRMGLVSPHTLERLVYVLTLTRHLDFGRNLLPLGVGATTEREEQLLERKDSLRPSRPVMMGVVPPPNVNPLTFDAPTTSKDIVTPQTKPLTTANELPTTTLEDSLKDLSPRPAEVMPKVQASVVTVTQAGKHTQAKTDPAIGERRAQLEKMSQQLESMDHFELLGLSKDVSVVSVQETYLRLAKTFHPDRLPLELADLKPVATKVFSRISEAHQVLCDPIKRQAYLDGLNRGGEDSEEEKVRRILRANGSFQKAEVLLKKRMLAAAELEANRALEDDPEQPDYLALYAWILSSKTDSEPRLPELLRMLNDAMTRNPASEKNRFYRVQILKRLGRTDEAVADCRIIVENNPHHVDALREIRLWEMRRSPQKPTPGAKPTAHKSHSKPPSTPPSTNKRPESPPGGLLGRLFKR
jgi:tetratricopeptide (TPR) repeat protein